MAHITNFHIIVGMPTILQHLRIFDIKIMQISFKLVRRVVTLSLSLSLVGLPPPRVCNSS